MKQKIIGYYILLLFFQTSFLFAQQNVTVLNCSRINTVEREFSPSFYKNGIVYVVSKNNLQEVDKKINEHFFELSFAELGADNLPANAKSFSLEINSIHHEGPVSITKDGNTLFFTTNKFKKTKNKKGRRTLRAYQVTRGQFDWSNLKEFPFNSDEYSVYHVAISSDGKELYFSSDMPGGFGGLDIWKSQRLAEGWDTPINLGAAINSSANEAFPFIHNDGFLFFASDKKQGFGGLDIYMKNLNEQNSILLHLDAPFNSENDDFGFILNDDGDKGFFSSDRVTGLGKDDIYFFESKGGITAKKESEISTKMLVIDAETKQRLEGAAIRVIELSADGLLKDTDLYDVVMQPSNENTKEVSIKMVRKNPDYIGTPDRYTTSNGDAFYKFADKVKYMVLVAKEGYATQEIPFSINGVQSELNVGLKRKSCVLYKGIVTNQGKPIANADVVIENKSDKSVIKLKSDKNGAFETCIPLNNAKYAITANKEGFVLPKAVEFLTGSDYNTILNGTIEMNLVENKPTTVKKTKETPKKEEPVVVFDSNIKAGAVVVLNNIYYEYNKAEIQKNAAKELDALVAFMKQNDSVEIELVAHTDCRGAKDYNLKLSQQRADAAKNFLIDNGIDANRIVAKGAGEELPRNECIDGVNCTEEQHQFNRRTEVKILKNNSAVQVKTNE